MMTSLFVVARHICADIRRMHRTVRPIVALLTRLVLFIVALRWAYDLGAELGACVVAVTQEHVSGRRRGTRVCAPAVS